MLQATSLRSTFVVAIIMSSSLPLYNLAGAPKDRTDSLLSTIRSTSYIAEVTSNEVPAEESGLWDAVVLVDELPSDVSKASSLDEKIKALVAQSGSGKWASASFFVIDERTSQDGSVLAVEVDGGKKKEVDRMRVAPKSVIEVVSGARSGWRKG